MDWLRRNWPDLLIGVALVAVIAGIVATLLSGGSLFPLGRGGGPTSVAASGPRSAGPNGGPSSPAGTTAPAEEEPAPTILPVLPDLGAISPSGPVVGDDTPPETDAGTTQADQDAASEAGAGDFVTSPSSGAPFRVSAGAYSIRSYADAQVQRLQDAGYPVFTGRQGDLFLVMVGPYQNRSRAESIAAELSSRELVVGPLVYECTDCGGEAAGSDSALATDRPATGAAGAGASASALGESASDAGATGEGAAAGQADSGPGTATASTGDGLYLQVGAYGSLNSAGPQRERMQELGYTVTVRRSGELVKLLIGPFDDGELGAAQARLGSQGIENFATR